MKILFALKTNGLSRVKLITGPVRANLSHRPSGEEQAGNCDLQHGERFFGLIDKPGGLERPLNSIILGDVTYV